MVAKLLALTTLIETAAPMPMAAGLLTALPSALAAAPVLLLDASVTAPPPAVMVKPSGMLADAVDVTMFTARPAATETFVPPLLAAGTLPLSDPPLGSLLVTSELV